MTKSEELTEKFQDRGISRGGILFLRFDAAMDLVNECKKNNIGILGIDGFHVTKDITQPFMEHSIDLSKESYEIQTTWRRAEQFLDERRSTDLLFEVVLAD